MVWQYNIADIKLGKPTYLGHEAYVDAVYVPADAKDRPYKVIFKKNKHGHSQYSRLEVAFSQLARLFLAKGSTAQQQLVVDEQGKVVGVATEHLCYVIDRKEGTNATFFTLADPAKNCSCIIKQVSQAEEIPYYFFDQLPQGFFATLLNAEKEGQLDIDYDSLASILASSYTLEEDDLHKGNFGFYIVEKNGRPQAVFFKIDHDLMLADSIMSFKAIRPFHIFHGADAFNITAEDLLNFPTLSSSSNIYWPTKLNFITKPWDPKAYLSSEETAAFSLLAPRAKFKRAKWLALYKHILLSKELIEEGLKECLNELVPNERAKIALVTEAAIARQARLRAVLFSIKEFRDCIASLTPQEHESLLLDLLGPSLESEVPAEVIDSMFLYQELCQSESFFEEGDTPLHTAIRLGDYRYQESIQMFGHFINVKNKAGKTPLDVAVDMLELIDPASVDIRKNVRLTMQHLLENGAEKSEHFELFEEKDAIEFYQFQSEYLAKAGSAKNYETLKNILRDVGEDHSFCLKSKKNLAIECVKQFIKENKNHPEMQSILEQLKRDMNGESPKSEHSPLLYIRQLRSRLWIIRLLRGLYGTTSTQTEINEIVDKELARIKPYEPGFISSLFGTANSAHKELDAQEAQAAREKAAVEDAAEERVVKERLAQQFLAEVDEMLEQIKQNNSLYAPAVPETLEIDDELHKALTKLRDEYETHLKATKNNEQTSDSVDAWNLFCSQWQSTIAAYEGTHTNLVQMLQQPLKKVAEEAANLAKAKRIGAIIGTIDKVLEELKININGINGYHSEAKDTAYHLHATLLAARDDYFVQLTSEKEQNKAIDADEAGELFKARCKSAVEYAMPILEKNLSWGAYLANALKALFNAVIYVVTIGNVNGFFSYTKSAASRVTTAADEELQQAEQSSFCPKA